MKTLFVMLLVLCAPMTALAAITVDNTASVDAGTGTSASLSMTIASGASLWVCVPGANPKSAPSSVTWNTSESLTQAAVHVPSAAFVTNSIWYLTNPTSGTHNITVTFGSSAEFDIAAVSLLGTDPSPLGAVSAGTDGVNTSLTDTVTTATANSWVMGCGTINGATGVTTVGITGTNQVSQIALNHTSSSGWQTEVDTIPATATGNYSIAYSISPSRNFNDIALEIKPAAAVATLLTPIIDLVRAFWIQ